MHDIKFIRKYPDQFDQGLASRGLKPMSAKIIELDKQGRDATTQLQKLKSRHNELSKSIGDHKKRIVEELIGPWGRVL